MPKKYRSIDYAAHYTQLYRGNPEGKKEIETSNIQELHKIVRDKINSMMGKEELPDDLVKLDNALKGFINSTKEAAGKIGTASPAELLQHQKDAAYFQKRIETSLNSVKGFEGDENFQFLKEDFFTRPCNKGAEVLKMSGQTKSAAKWIESFRKGVPSNGPVPDENLALVFAARQLANAKLGKRANIDKTQLSEQQIRRQAEILMDSPEFKKFREQVADNPKLFHTGHGGKLEKTFEDFLAKEGKGDLEFDHGKRYQKAINEAAKAKEQQSEWVNLNEGDFIDAPTKVEGPKYTDYADYFKQNIKGGDKTTAAMAHAAKMAAAYDLSQRKPDAPFDRAELNKRTQQFLNDPGFKIMNMDPNVTQMFREGKAADFVKEADDFAVACRSVYDLSDKFNPKGEIEAPLNRLTEAAKSDPALKKIVDGFNSLKGTQLEEGKSEKKVAELLNDMIEYQNKNASANTVDSPAKNVDDTLRLFYETTKGTYLQSVVESQMKKINAARGFSPEHPRYLTINRIAKEGRETAELKKMNRDLDDLIAGKKVGGYEVPKEHRGRVKGEEFVDKKNPNNLGLDGKPLVKGEGNGQQNEGQKQGEVAGGGPSL